MPIDFLKDVFRRRADADAFVWRDRPYTYRQLSQRMEASKDELEARGVGRGAVVMLHADFSPGAVATLLSLFELGCIAIPVGPSSEDGAAEFARIGRPEFAIRMTEEGAPAVEPTGDRASHELYEALRARGGSGLVLFTSGSSGDPRAVVHDVSRLMRKYRTPRHCYRTLGFLLFDHIGGLDTALYSLSNGSCLVVCEDRSPEGVCRAIEAHRVEVLPTAPSFLNLLALSGAAQRFDLSSVEVVTYGAEVMPESTLRRCGELFPGATLLQKYGTSEVGTLRSRSRSSDSLWVKLGGEGVRTRVVDGRLEIKTESSMLGYLNGASPFTEDGWFPTGDHVEVDGEYVRFLGRDSDTINVGGQKVHPAEVESVIAALDNVREVAVFGEANALLGQIVCARVRLATPEDPEAVTRRIRKACRGALERYKVPVRVEVSDTPLSTSRQKVRRRA